MSKHFLETPIKTDGKHSDVTLQMDKFIPWMESRGVTPFSDQFWGFWSDVEHLRGFQVSVGRGGGKKNTEGDTWREDCHKLARVADYIHRHGVGQGKAAALCGINEGYLSNLINGKYEFLWKALMDGRSCEAGEKGAVPDGDGWRLTGKTVTAGNLKLFADLMDAAKL